MLRYLLPSLVALGAAMSAQVAPAAELPAQSTWVRFTSFSYAGTDPAAEKLAADPDAPGKFLNPILAGFYPDPSICRAQGDYYLVNSSFWYYPGIPVFHSKDLVHWTQIGFALDRPSQFSTIKGGDVSRGVYAPSIRYRNGTFYITCTLVNGRGNFLLSAKDPAGPWEGPFWLESVDGIDPSLFFDDDGQSYLLHCAPPMPGTEQYQGHRTIRMRQIDLQTAQLVGDEKVLVNAGTDITRKPQWVEGPHLYKKNGTYWLIAAEGGTAADHSVVAFESGKLWGPYTPIPENPILSQRQLANRADAITCAGHADFVELPNGDWWSVFLGCRPYEANLYNTGRETFLLPVSWDKDKPAILPPDKVVPRVLSKPAIPAAQAPAAAAESATTGNLSWTDTFKPGKLNLRWQLLRAPTEAWYALAYDSLAIAPRNVALTSYDNPSFVACRQQHAAFTATAELALNQGTAACDAGIVAFQNETHYFFLGVRVNGRTPEVFLEQFNVPEARRTAEKPKILATLPLPVGVGKDSTKVELRITGAGRPYSFSCRINGGEFKSLKENVDGSFLSTETAGGFQGVMLGMYARN
ncbi:MAG TPA: glycoside hydrolase family 43 protein [Phycisphaerae bacterium]|nr:glycoside hydrolase family 43 protein [Phycisphaerae bacterium]